MALTGRNCGWCIHPDLPKWEARLAAGETVSAVAALTPFSALQAIREERDTIATISDRLGVDSGEAASLLSEVKAVMKAMSRAISTDQLASLEALAWLMDEEGAPAVAKALRARAREGDRAATSTERVHQ